MSTFNKYHVFSGDVFKSADYPEITTELDELSRGIRSMPGYGKTRAIVSFLKDHHVKDEWVKANAVVIEEIRSGTFKIERIESMFQACRYNHTFLLGFEKYISDGLNKR